MRYPATNSITLLLLLAASALQAQSVNSGTSSAVTLSGNYTVASSGTTTFYKQSSGDLQFTGLITGGGVGATLYLNTSAADSLTTFTFSGANTFVGRIQLNRGSLVVNHLNALGNASNEVYLNSYVNNSVGNLRFNISGTFANPINNYESVYDNSIGVGSNNVTLTGNIYGGGGLRKYGSGSLTVTGTNTYANGTYNYAGTLQIGNGGTTGTLGQGSVVNSGTLIFNRSNNFEVTNSISGSGSVEVAGTGRLDMRSTIGASGGLTIRSGTLRFVGSPSTDYLFGGTAVTIDGGTLDYGGYSESNGATVTLKSGTITNGIAFGTAYAFESGLASVVLAGTGSLTKTTAGTVTLSGTNTYSGTTTISAGTLQIGNGGTTGVLGGGAVTNNATLIFNRSNSMTVSNAISGTGALVQAGAGTTTVSGSNSFTGGTTVQAGKLLLGSANRLADTGAVTVSGGTFDLGGFSDTVGVVTISGGSIINGTLTGSSYAAQSGTVSAVLAGNGALTKTGAGTVTLSGANTYTGSTTIDAGILATSGADRIATGNSVTVNASGTLQLGGNQTLAAVSGAGAINLGNHTLTTGTSTSTFAGSISGTGGLVKSGAGTLTLSGSSTFEGDTTVSAGTLILANANALARDAVVSLAAGATLTVNQRTFIGALDQAGGSINGAGELVSTLTLTNSGSLNAVLADGVDFAAGILKRTSGVTTVGAANTFTGTVKVQGGTLRLAQGGSFNSASTLVLSDGATMDLDGKSQGFSEVTGTAGTVALGSGTLTINDATNTAFGGAITGTGGVTKTGAGLLELTGTSTYTGQTDVQSGHLKVNGSLATSALSVAAPATLSGTGTIAGDVTITGTHTPGNSPGVQTIGGNLTYTTGSLGIVWELAGNTAALADRGTLYDGIDVGGDLAVAGSTPVNLVFDLAGSTVDWSDTFWDTDKLGTDGWLLLDVGGTAYDANNLSIVLLDYLDSQGQLLSEVRANGAFSLQQVGSDIYLTYTAIPEPSTYGLILGALALAGAAVRRRRVG